MKDYKMGISNVRDNQELLYDNDLTLECGAEKGVYNVLMYIPTMLKGSVL